MSASPRTTNDYERLRAAVLVSLHRGYDSLAVSG